MVVRKKQVPISEQETAQFVQRKNQVTLSDPEKAQFVQAILTLKANGTYDRYVREHIDYALAGHRGPAFFSWHREFLRRFERDVQKAARNPNLGLPYWNWSFDNSPNSSIWGPGFMGGNGRASDGQVMDGPFAFNTGNWTLNVRTSGEPPYLRRQFGVSIPSLPTQADVEDTLKTGPYDVAPWNISSGSGFRNKAEGWIPGPGPQMHNRVHVWVGGSMLPMTSPNDPVFFLHHCFVDKQWADWQVRQLELGGGDYNLYLPLSGASPGHNLEDAMPPWNQPNDTVTPADVLYNHGQMGYRYDTDTDMQPFDELMPGQRIYSRGNTHCLTYQSDGNLVLYWVPSWQQLWNSHTAGQPVGVCRMEGDGNLVIYGPNNQMIWASGTSGHTGSRLVVLPGKVVIYELDGRVIWSTP